MRYTAQAGKIGVFSNMTTVLPSSGLLNDHPGSLQVAGGTLARPDSGARTPELAKPLHNSGQKGQWASTILFDEAVLTRTNTVGEVHHA
jgi:hypothetical protein